MEIIKESQPVFSLGTFKKHTYLKDVLILIQYELEINGSKKLLTFIGEKHIDNEKCNKYDKNKCSEHRELLFKTIDIGDYVIGRITNNPNTKVLLEYNPDISINRINIYKSDALQSIYKYIIKDDYSCRLLEKSIIPTDYRPLFLEKKFHEELYYGIYYSRLPLTSEYINDN